MKTHQIVVGFIFMFCSSLALADNPRVKGYYVSTEGDTVKALLEVVVNIFDKKKVSEPGFLFGITAVDKGKEIKLGENDVQAFGFMYMGQRYDFRFVKEILVPGVIGHMDAGGTFLRLLARGNCDLYFATTVDGRTDEYFFRRGEGDNYLTKNSSSIMSHDKDLVKFFEDCPVLANKIKNKDYKEYKDKDKYLQMVKFYNTSCESKQVEEE